VNVSHGIANNVNADDFKRDDLRAAMLRPLDKVKIDTERAIGKVRRRVSSLVDTNLDREALAKSILASGSLLKRDRDIVRFLDEVRVPFDDRSRATDDRRNRNVSDMAPVVRPRDDETTSNFDRFNARVGTPPVKISSDSALIRPASVKNQTISAGKEDSTTELKTLAASSGEPVAASSACPLAAEGGPENFNASATSTIAEDPRGLESMRAISETVAATEWKENETLADALIRGSTHCSNEDVRRYGEQTKATVEAAEIGAKW